MSIFCLRAAGDKWRQLLVRLIPSNVEPLSVAGNLLESSTRPVVVVGELIGLYKMGTLSSNPSAIS